jgi:hypothetical protein
MKKSYVVELMVERINSANRVSAVKNNTSLIELEKYILEMTPMYRELCSELLNVLQSKDLLQNIDFN